VYVARIGAKRNAYRILVEKPEGKRSLGRPRRREMIWGGTDGIKLAQDMYHWRALVNTALKLFVP
jgi:hypothetical protein